VGNAARLFPRPPDQNHGFRDIAEQFLSSNRHRPFPPLQSIPSMKPLEKLSIPHFGLSCYITDRGLSIINGGLVKSRKVFD
jgi:hypothetical protein